MSHFLLRMLVRLFSAGPVTPVAHDALPHAHWNRAIRDWVTHEADPAEVVRAA